MSSRLERIVEGNQDFALLIAQMAIEKAKQKK